MSLIDNTRGSRTHKHILRKTYEQANCLSYFTISSVRTSGAHSNPHPLVEGKVVRNSDVNDSFLAIAFQGQADGLDIPFQTGVVKVNCSPGCPQEGLLLPRIKVKGADGVVRNLPVPTNDIFEITGASITGRISTVGRERLLFSNGAVLEIIAPRSDLRILMYVEDPSQGDQIAVLWDV